MRVAFEDIFYSHNKNLFSRRCRGDRFSPGVLRRLLFQTSWMEEDQWQSKICSLADMNWQQNGIPFVVAPKPPWYRKVQQTLQACTTQDGTPWHEQLKIFDELQNRLYLPEEITNQLVNSEFGKLMNFILSCVEGKPIASEEKNLIALTNSFLYANAGKRYANIIRETLLVTGNAAVLERQSVRDKLHSASRFSQAEGVLIDLCRAIFPDLFENRLA